MTTNETIKALQHLASEGQGNSNVKFDPYLERVLGDVLSQYTGAVTIDHDRYVKTMDDFKDRLLNAKRAADLYCIFNLMSKWIEAEQSVNPLSPSFFPLPNG